MSDKETHQLIRKAAGNGPALSDKERGDLRQHFDSESAALAAACEQRKLERKRGK